MNATDLIAMARERGGTVGPTLAETMSSCMPVARKVYAAPALDCLEAELQARVTEFAEDHGWIWYHTYDSRRSRPGFLDLVCASEDRKRVLFAEIKRECGKMSKAQERWFKVLQRCGEEVYLWRPSDWPRIVETLR